MASRPEKEAMALSGVANFLQAYIQAKKEKQAQDREEQRFNATLASKRLEDEQAERWKRAQFALDQEQTINRIAGMGREQFFIDPRTGQTTNQAPVMNPADIQAAQERVRGILPGARYGYTPNAPVIGLAQADGVSPQQASVQPPSAMFPGVSAGVPMSGQGDISVDPTQPTSEATAGRLFPRPGTGVKTTGKDGGEDSTKTSDKQAAKRQVSDMANILRDAYRKLKDRKAIVSTGGDPAENVSAAVRASDVGQMIGRAGGTENQQLRDQANTTIPLMIQAVRKATEMGARGLDTEKELEFYLRAASSPKLSYEANMKALDVLELVFGDDTPANRAKLLAAEREAQQAAQVVEASSDVVAEYIRGPDGKLQRVK